MGRVTARVFWGPRPQAVDDGVAAIVATLVGLRELDKVHYGRWFDRGGSRKDALQREVSIDPEGITPYVHADPVVEDLGYNFSAWNGAARDEDSASFDCNFSVTDRKFKNRVTFDLPRHWKHDLDRGRQALDVAIQVWRPERANLWNYLDMVEIFVVDL